MWSANFRRKISKQVLVAVFFSAVTGSAFAQSYFHSPNDTLIAYTTVNNSVTMNITQVHPGSDTLQFVWEKLSFSFPADWTATICDNTTCYPSLTWIIHAESTTGLDKPDTKPVYTLIGNRFQLNETGSGYSNLSLLDLSGKEVFSGSISAGSPLDIPILPSAFYYLVISGNNNIIRQKIWHSTN